MKGLTSAKLPTLLRFLVWSSSLLLAKSPRVLKSRDCRLPSGHFSV